MTVDEFLMRAALELQMFRASYVQHALTEPDSYPSAHTVEEWWQEFAAYQHCLVLQDLLTERRMRQHKRA